MDFKRIVTGVAVLLIVAGVIAFRAIESRLSFIVGSVGVVLLVLTGAFYGGDGGFGGGNGFGDGGGNGGD